MIETPLPSLSDNVSTTQHALSLELTFAGLDALQPSMISVSIAGTSAFLIPRTARSATTGSAGFLERSTLWARRRSDWLASY